MRQPPRRVVQRRVAEHGDVGDQRGDALVQESYEGAQPRLRLRRLLSGGAQRDRRGDDRGDVDIAGDAAALAFVRGERRAVADALADRQDADAGRAAPLVRGGGQRGPGPVDPAPGDGLRGVDEERDVRLGRELGHLGHRLDGADLVVGRLEAGERGPGGVQRRLEGVGKHPSEGVDGNRRHRTAVRLESLGGVQYGGVFDGGMNEMTPFPVISSEQSENGEMVRLRT